MTLASNYTRQISSCVIQARSRFLSGDIRGTLSSYDSALRPFAGYCVSRGVLPAAQMPAFKAALAMTEKDLDVFPMDRFCDGASQHINAGIRNNKRAVIVLGPSAAGKNIFASYLAQNIHRSKGFVDVIDIDNFNFIERKKLSTTKPLSVQFAEGDVLQLGQYVEAVNRSLGNGNIVILPVWEMLLGKLPYHEWPCQMIRIIPKRPGSHNKVFRWLVFQMVDFARELDNRGEAHYLEIIRSLSGGQEGAELKGLPRPDYIIDSGSGICRGSDGDVVCRFEQKNNVFEENPFFDALHKHPGDALIRGYIINRKMFGMMKAWERLAVSG